MGQRPIAIRLKVKSKILRGNGEVAGFEASEVSSVPPGCDTTGWGGIVCGVSEAARQLGVSERTVFRLLKAGRLERVEEFIVSHNECRTEMSDMKPVMQPDSHAGNVPAHTVMTDNHDKVADMATIVKVLNSQLVEKDLQIAHLLGAQQEMRQALNRLQEQMFELAHLVLAHNVAVAQARAESEIKTQEQNLRSGFANFLGGRNRK